jgi:hypothetical protein
LATIALVIIVLPPTAKAKHSTTFMGFFLILKNHETKGDERKVVFTTLDVSLG